MLKVGVVDGQGGGIGSLVVKKLRETFSEEIEIYAFGTNAIATAAMMKARANKGATGENAIKVNISEMDVIIGPLSIVMANSMMGELTPSMAEAISSAKALKILIPLAQESVEVVGVQKEPLPHLIDTIIDRLKLIMEKGGSDV